MTEFSVGIVIPAYNRSKLLQRTLDSLEEQTFPAERLSVVVADDGSEEDLATLAGSWQPPFRKSYVRQERQGFGAGRARNLGASQLDCDILIFLDSDAMVQPDFVESHHDSHDGTHPAVVIGGRVHVNKSGKKETSEDFRAELSRRTSRYTRTDEGYRAFVSSNVSLPHDLFRDVGGFDERFRWWGSEDTELGWRLWQSGADFVDASSIEIRHQLETDTAGGAEGRQKARELNRGLLTTLIPQRFYRKGLSDVLYEVPKVSVVIHDLVPEGPAEIWRSLVDQTRPDFEAIFVGDPADHDPFAGASVGDPRCSFQPNINDAVSASRGEYVLFIDGHSAPSRTMLANIAKRLDQRPAVDALEFGIAVPGEGDFGTIEDIRAVNLQWAAVAPLSMAIRRRRLVRSLGEGLKIEKLATTDITTIHSRRPLLALPASSRTQRPSPFVYGKSRRAQALDEARLGPSDALRAGIRLVRERRQTSADAPAPIPATVVEESASHRPSARYIGWVGKDNLGDDAMLLATRNLLPWADIETRGEAKRLLLLGGGTLINRGQYLSWIADRDSPRIERAVFGTGVASVDYWGLTEGATDWASWLETCAYVGVRGPHSRDRLAAWGVKADIEICGDPALGLVPTETLPSPGRVLIAPAWTDGELWGKSDLDVYKALAGAASTWIDEGREVVLMSCHPTDDRPVIIMQELLGGRPTTYVAGYRNVEKALDEIAGSETVIGERLHACVLAAAAGRPFVGVEYRPKLADFAASVGMGDHLIRTDEVDSNALHEHVIDLDSPPKEMLEMVEVYRKRLNRAARIVRSAVDV